jgi:tetratricopeptide (TPR) repeat protein
MRAEDAVRQDRELVKKSRSAQNLQRLAKSLSSLAQSAKAAEALAAAEEATTLFTELASASIIYAGELAYSWNAVALLRSQRGHHEAAIQAGQEMLAILINLSNLEGGEAVRPDLVRSLGAMGTIYLAAGKPGDAATKFLQATQLSGLLMRTDANKYGDLAASLVNDYIAAAQKAGIAPGVFRAELEALGVKFD